MLGAVVAFPVAVVLVHEPRKPGNEQNDTGDDYQGQPPLDTCSVRHSRHKLSATATAAPHASGAALLGTHRYRCHPQPQKLMTRTVSPQQSRAATAAAAACLNGLDKKATNNQILVPKFR